MAPKKLWFNLHYDGKLVKNFFLKNVYVKSVCTTKEGPPIYFKAEDQPIAKHPILKDFVKDNSIKFNRCKKIEVTFKSTKDYEVYHDKSTSRLWFNGKHLTGTAGQKNTLKPNTPKSTKKPSEKVSKTTRTPRKKSSSHLLSTLHLSNKKVMFCLQLAKRKKHSHCRNTWKTMVFQSSSCEKWICIVF